MRNNSVKIQLIIQVCLIILGFLLGGLCMLIIMKLNLIDAKNYNGVRDETKVYEKNSLSKSVEKVYDDVVAVEEHENGSVSSSGTGFIYKTDANYGYILTNEHVLGNATDVKVVLSNEKEIPTKVLGKDVYLDLAVLRIDKKYVSLIAAIGSSENTKLGDTVFTIGSPLGTSYRGSVSSGILSGKNRLVSTTATKTDEYDWVMSVLQIDAPLNPGNSGGPLLNTNGEVIGVCSMKLVDDNIEGMGFAIPIEVAMRYVDKLEQGVKIKWPLIGISMVEATDSNLQLYNVKVPDNFSGGVIVTGVKKNTGAEKAGIEKNDIIIKVNDVVIKDIAYFRYELYKYQAGDTIKVTYLRDGKEKTAKVVLSNA